MFRRHLRARVSTPAISRPWSRLGVFALAVFGILLSSDGLGAWPLPPAETEELYVASFDNDLVLVYDSNGVYLRSFGHTDLDGTRGIMVSSLTGEIYVASELNSRILVFDRDETLLRSLTHPEMIRPTGLAEGPDGRIYASAWTTDRVVVFDSDESYLFSFNGGGLNGPNCVAFDSAGDIYVASALTANVLKYDSSGNFLFAFTGGGLTSPMSVARSSDDVLYVSGGGSDDVVRFDTSGTMIDEITLPAVFGPQGVVFDAAGHWYVSSFYQDVIYEYDEADTFVRAITDGPQDTPRSMSFYTPPAASSVPGRTRNAGHPGPLRHSGSHDLARLAQSGHARHPHRGQPARIILRNAWRRGRSAADPGCSRPRRAFPSPRPPRTKRRFTGRGMDATSAAGPSREGSTSIARQSVATAPRGRTDSNRPRPAGWSSFADGSRPSGSAWRSQREQVRQ